ncbi:MAG: HlyD family efflux transporter periplasmic adaptor subunit [Verrucomicrobia bacterium]|nr:HlyD family efflux transporter periplasmic adaptor subunit [Verrucomicrobiota bacterium]
MKNPEVKASVQQSLTKRPAVTAALGLILLIVAFVGIRRWTTPPPVEQQFHTVKRGDMLISVVEGGALKAVNESIIRSEFEGMSRIISIVPEGTYAKKGDLLVELDSSELKDRLNQQEVSYQNSDFAFVQAKENLSIQRSLVDSQIKDAELRAEFAKSDLDKYIEGDAPQQINTQTNNIIIRKEQLQRAQDKLDWTQQLFKKGYASKSELEADGLSLMQSKISLEQAEEDLRLFRKYDMPKSVRRLESAWDQAKMELGRLKQRTSNQIAQAEADLRTRQRALELTLEKLNELKQQFENSRIKAPQDGLVVYASSNPFIGGSGGQILIEEGAQIRQRQEIIKLPDVSQMLVEIRVHESHVLQIRAGLDAYVTVDSIPDRRFKAKVKKVAVLPNSQDRWMNPNLKVYSTDVLIEDELPDLKPGVSARAEIIVTNLVQALTVPLQAVTTVKGKQVCYVQNGKGTTPAPVVVGNFNDQFIEIKSGLKEGDRVLLSPPAATDNADLSGSIISSAELEQQRTAPPATTAPKASPGNNNTSTQANPGREAESASGSIAAVATGQPAVAPGIVPPTPPAATAEPGSEFGGRRRGGNDPEAQKRREEFMKLSPEERAARMQQFRGRRGQPVSETSAPQNRNPE